MDWKTATQCAKVGLTPTGLPEQVRTQRQGAQGRWRGTFPGERTWMLSGFAESRQDSRDKKPNVQQEVGGSEE